MAERVTQQIIGALSLVDAPYVNASQIVVATFVQPVPGVRATQTVLDALALVEPGVRASQVAVQTLGLQPAPFAYVSQIVIEVLVWNHEVLMPSIYPTLPGLTYSVIKRPKFFTGIGTSASGREVRVAYAANPLWEWDLTYNYLPDEQTDTSATPSDLKQIVGFYLSVAGAFAGFLFQDPDDFSVTGQPIGTTDGVTTNWTLVRTYGGGDGTGTEPIGYLNTAVAFNVYLGGALVDPANYAVLTTTPVLQQIKFGAAPAIGQAITVDMSYYYYVRFAEDHYDFEKFFDKLWSLQKVTLMSQRG